jgi:hypothetical protein
MKFIHFPASVLIHFSIYRDIVLASHIKPLDKKDRLDQIERFTQLWNVHARPGNEATETENAEIKVS